jgi:acetyl esterase/lipase
VNLSHPPADSIPTDFLVPYINRRAYPSLARHFPSDALQTNPYFSPGVAGDFSWLTNTQRLHDGLPHVWIQHGDSELLTPDQRKWVDKMQAEGVEMSIDVIKGGAHLDAGIAYALLERGEDSSWNRLLDAIRKMVTSL